MKQIRRTSTVVGIRKSKLINQTLIPQWEPASGFEDFYKPVVSIELRIDKFAEFAASKGVEDQRWSALTSIRGLLWQIYAFPEEVDENDSQKEQSLPNALACYLHCKNKTADTTLNCQVKFNVRVVSQKEDVDDFVKFTPEHVTYNDNCNVWGYSLITMDKLLDPDEGFIKDDTVILQVDLTSIIFNGIQQVDEDRNQSFKDVFGSFDKYRFFSSSTDYPWDFVLIVEGKRVYVQKNILSLDSEYFKEQFAKYKNAKRAILRNIDHDEFIELLSIIYPTSYPITVSNVETIVRLAYVLKVHTLLQQCEVFLMRNISKFGRLRTFLMCHWYGLGHLQAKCIGEIKAIDDPKNLQEEPEYSALDCRAKAILLDKIIESNPAMSSATNHRESLKTDLKSRASIVLDKLNSSALVDSDGVLIVENKRIPIHKSILAISSEYFKSMFLGEFKEKDEDEIVLEEVSYTDILELLAVIYPCGDYVTDKNLDAVLKLADRFIMPVVLERCKKILKRSNKIKRSLKLWLAQRYNFPDLQTKYAMEYKNVDDVKKLKAEPEYESLNDYTRSLIFDSITS